MHSTRRRLDRRGSRTLVAVLLVSSSGTVASCSSSTTDGGALEAPSLDAATPEASTQPEPDAASTPDAGMVEAKPLPIVCASTPCATALVTTLGAGPDDRSEGFCALLSDGTVACWGANDAGQLGRGDDAGTVDSAEPARVVGVSDVVMLDHTCALDKAGSVWCWGTGPFLRNGDGSTSTERTPVRLDLPPATTVAVGYRTACAAVAGGVQCWGSNASAQLSPPGVPLPDAGPFVDAPLPAGAPVRRLAVGSATFVLREDGTLVTWGANPPAGRVSPMFPDPFPQSIVLGNIQTVDLIHDNACAIASGVGHCWGAPVPAPTGLSADRILDRALPEPVVTPEPIVRIATTRSHLLETAIVPYRWCATSVSGAVYCWGFNQSGQAGDGTQNHAYEPVKVQGLKERAADVKTTTNTTCALLTNGNIQCWGSNYNGQLGNGQIKGRSFVPVEVLLP